MSLLRAARRCFVPPITVQPIKLRPVTISPMRGGPVRRGAAVGVLAILLPTLQVVWPAGWLLPYPTIRAPQAAAQTVPADSGAATDGGPTATNPAAATGTLQPSELETDNSGIIAADALAQPGPAVVGPALPADDPVGAALPGSFDLGTLPTNLPAPLLGLPVPTVLGETGIHAGAFLFYPEATVSTGYNDNIFAASDDEEGDLVTDAQAALSARTTWSRHALSANASLRRTQYLDHGSENETAFQAALAGRVDITGADSVGLNVGYRHASEARTAPEADSDDDDDRPEFDRFSADARYTGRRMGYGLSFSGGVDVLVFEDDEEDDRNRVDSRLSTRLSRRVAPRTDIFVQPSYVRQDFTNEDDGDADVYTVLVGSSLASNGLFAADVGIGTSHQRFRSSDLDPTTSFSANGLVTWTPTGMTTVTARLRRETTVSQDFGASSLTLTEARLNVRHELLREVFLLGDASYLRDRFRDADLTDDTLALTVGAEYVPDPSLQLGIDLTHRTRASDDDDRDYDQNIARLRVTARF